MRRPYPRMLVPALSRYWTKFLSRRDNLRIAQRFSVGFHARENKVPKGRLIDLGTEPFSTVPSGLGHDSAPFPTLKRWAIVAYPFGINALFSLFLSVLVKIGRAHV